MIELPDISNGKMSIDINDTDLTVAEVLLQYREKYPWYPFSRTDVQFIYKTTRTGVRATKRTVHITRFLRYCGNVFDIKRRVNLYPTIRAQLSISGIKRIYMNVVPGRNIALYFYLTDRRSLYSVGSTDKERTNRSVDAIVCDISKHRERWI